MTKKKRSFLLLCFLVLGVGLLFGFLMAQLPDERLVAWGLKAPVIRILIQNTELLPFSVQKEIQDNTGFSLEVRTYATGSKLPEMADFFDVFIGPTCDLLRISKWPGEAFVSDKAKELNLSPDFEPVINEDASLLPIFWWLDSHQHLVIDSLKFKKIQPQQALIHGFLDFITSSSFLRKWSMMIHQPTTFLDIDDKLYPAELKAGNIRTLSLQGMGKNPLNCN